MTHQQELLDMRTRLATMRETTTEECRPYIQGCIDELYRAINALNLPTHR